MKSLVSNSNNFTKNLGHNSSIRNLFSSKKPTVTLTKLQEAGIHRIQDLMWVFPNKIFPIPKVRPFSFATLGELFCGEGKIISRNSFPVRSNFYNKKRSKIGLNNITVIVKDFHSEDMFHLKWFNAYSSQFKKLLETESLFFWGKVDQYQNHLQIINPNLENSSLNISAKNEIYSEYPTINGIGPKKIGPLFNKIFENSLANFNEYLNSEQLVRRQMSDLKTSFQILHGRGFNNFDEYKIKSIPAKKRLIYHEFFQEQLKLYLRKNIVKTKTAQKIEVTLEVLNSFINIFPYDITHDQKKVLNEILDDLKSERPMSRMVQGDVGCGKTTVAILAALVVAKNNFQVALMCPTESLAVQHFNTFQKYLKNLNLKIEISLGGQSNKTKKEIQKQLKSGFINIIIGTHALLSKEIEFSNLGLTIIDEQHKFGVDQRTQLINKGKNPHTLIMTATPIPRSLGLTQYGDLDLSIIKHMPQNRKATKTKIVFPDQFPLFLNFVKTRIDLGEQVFVVVPAIEESRPGNSEIQIEMQNLIKVHERFDKIFHEYGVLSLHGRMSSDEKRDILHKFSDNQAKILISTSVVEVGIDIPQASIMAILNPERFGLSSLHQLRGRIGRGKLPGFCFLILDKVLEGQILKRIEVIEKCHDGFKIAEEDLKIRGEGDLLGVNQSGICTPKKLANLVEHESILIEVREDIDKMAKQESERLKLIIDEFMKDEQQIIHLN